MELHTDSTNRVTLMTTCRVRGWTGPQGQGPGATLCFLSGLWSVAVWGRVWQCGLLDASVCLLYLEKF